MNLSAEPPRILVHSFSNGSVSHPTGMYFTLTGSLPRFCIGGAYSLITLGKIMASRGPLPLTRDISAPLRHHPGL